MTRFKPARFPVAGRVIREGSSHPDFDSSQNTVHSGFAAGGDFFPQPLSSCCAAASFLLRHGPHQDFPPARLTQEKMARGVVMEKSGSSRDAILPARVFLLDTKISAIFTI